MRRLLTCMGLFGLLYFSLTPIAFAEEVKTESAKERNMRIRLETIDRELQTKVYEERRARDHSQRTFNEYNEALRKKNWEWWRKNYWQQRADLKAREHQGAKETEEKAIKNADEKGREYLKGEAEFFQEAGHYLDPDKKEYWEGRIGESYTYTPATPGGGNEDGDKVTQIKNTADSIKQAFASGMSGNKAAGFAEGKAKNLQDLTRGLMLEAHKSMEPQTPARRSAHSLSTRPRNAFTKKMDSGASLLAGAAATGENLLDVLPSKKILLSRPEDASKYAKRKRVHDGRQILREGENQIFYKNFDGALRTANDYIRENPDSPLGYALQARALNGKRNFNAAAAAAQQTLARDPGSTDALRQLTWAQLHTGKYEDAAKNASQWIRLNPHAPHAYLMRAFAYEKLGLRQKMLQDLARAAELDARYEGHYQKAKEGAVLFDPGTEDSESMLEPLPFTAPRGPNLKIILGALMVLFGLAAAVFPHFTNGLMTLIKKIRAGAAQKPSTTAFAPPPSPSATGSPEPGLLANKYRLGSIIGHGGMGKVWEGEDTTLGRRVAIKQTLSHVGEQGSAIRDLYLKEARTLAGLKHPNIVGIFEILNRNDGVFLILEYIEGKTVEQLLIERRKLTWTDACNILSPVAGALTCAHAKGIIHRDLKPSNIMLSHRGYIKVMDFGIARLEGTEAPGLSPDPVSAATGDLRMQHTRTLAGTPAYMPPESYAGRVSAATDVFSLGVCLYQMLTGVLPFGEEGLCSAGNSTWRPASSRVAGLDPRVDTLISHALAANVEDRIASPGQLAARMQSIDE